MRCMTARSASPRARSSAAAVASAFRARLLAPSLSGRLPTIRPLIVAIQRSTAGALDRAPARATRPVAVAVEDDATHDLTAAPKLKTSSSTPFADRSTRGPPSTSERSPSRRTTRRRVRPAADGRLPANHGRTESRPLALRWVTLVAHGREKHVMVRASTNPVHGRNGSNCPDHPENGRATSTVPVRTADEARTTPNNAAGRPFPR